MHNIVGKDIALAAQLIKDGRLVAMPTETVYGLAANALDEQAVKQIYQVKNRPDINPLIIHVASSQQVDDYATNVPPVARLLMEKFAPGPLTVVLPRKATVPDIVTAGKDTVAIRIPAHPVAQQLLSATGLPLAAPSANPSGYISPTNAQHVYNTLGNKVSYILDGGACTTGIESTIIGFRQDIPVIYRQGTVTAEDIAAVAGSVETFEGNTVLAPGMSAAHYSPATPMILADDIEEAIISHKGLRLAIITYGTYARNISSTNQVLLCTNDWQLAARNLYAAMHIVDSKDYDLIIARRFPAAGIGNALNDRLKRAAAKK